MKKDRLDVLSDINKNFKAIGLAIKKAREEQNISIVFLSEALKINEDYLMAIEKGDKSSLPELVYVKAMLRKIFERLNIEIVNTELDHSSKEKVSIPVMAKCRIGHFVEAQILESLEIDFIDESEVLTPADHKYHVDKRNFKIPFVCGARNLGEALRRINEGAAMIRTKGEAGSGNIVEAVKHMRAITDEIKNTEKNRIFV